MDTAQHKQRHLTSKRSYLRADRVLRIVFEKTHADFNCGRFVGSYGDDVLERERISIDSARVAAITESVALYRSYFTPARWVGEVWITGGESRATPARRSRTVKATLALDDDVAALLEQTRRERGRSPEEMGNELLRRTLRQLSASSREPEPAAPRAAQLPDAPPLEAQIDELYDEIRDLVVHSAENPGLKTEIEHKREKLRALQAEEAAAWRRRADARLHLKPGEGYRLLERAARLLGS